MPFHEYMIEVTQQAFDEVFRYANAVPADRLDWKPADGVRSVLELCQELALCPTWCKEVLDPETKMEWSEEKAAAIRELQSQWTSAQAFQKEGQRRLNELFEFFRTIPDSRLTETKWLPYNGGRDHTVREMMDYPRWNCNYHLGQIAYVQLMYGDPKMY